MTISPNEQQTVVSLQERRNLRIRERLPPQAAAAEIYAAHIRIQFLYVLKETERRRRLDMISRGVSLVLDLRPNSKYAANRRLGEALAAGGKITAVRAPPLAPRKT